MNLSSVDLNLLVAFDALVAERSVTRAAKRLGLSQPAASNALRRLRDLLDDPVLVRAGSSMVPTERALDVIPLYGARFAFGLGNGTVGVYEGSTQVWSVRSKHSVTGVVGYDLDGDDVPEVVSGWANGKFEVRKDHNGEVIYRDNLGAPVVGMCQADYRMDGKRTPRRLLLLFFWGCFHPAKDAAPSQRGP